MSTGKIKLLLILVFLLLLTACENGPIEVQEREHLYWKDIECEIVDSRFNAAVPVLCSGWVKVKSEEYNLEATFDLRGEDAHRMREYITQAHRNGIDNPVVICQLDSWKYDSTGEITRRVLCCIQVSETVN